MSVDGSGFNLDYRDFFEHVVNDLNATRPGVPWKLTKGHRNWISVLTVRGRADKEWFGVGFPKDGLHVDFHIGLFDDRALNMARAQEIYRHLNSAERSRIRPNQMKGKAARLKIRYGGRIKDTACPTDYRRWTVDAVLELYDAVKHHI